MLLPPQTKSQSPTPWLAASNARRQVGVRGLRSIRARRGVLSLRRGSAYRRVIWGSFSGVVRVSRRGMGIRSGMGSVGRLAMGEALSRWGSFYCFLEEMVG